MKKTHIFISVCMLLFMQFASAQTPSFSWAVSDSAHDLMHGGNNSCYGRAVTTDKDGNVIVTGDYVGVSDPVYFGSNKLSQVSTGIFLAKYDQHGKLIWVKSITAKGASSPSGRAIQTDRDGNIYFAGWISVYSFTGQDTVYFGKIPVHGLGTFVAKYDPDGNAIWAKTNSTAECFALSLDQDANVYIAGQSNYTYNFKTGVDDCSATVGSKTVYGTQYVAKYKNNGTLDWVKGFGSRSVPAGHPFLIVAGMKCDTNNNVVLTADFTASDTVNFVKPVKRGDSIFNGKNNLYAFYVTKLDSGGKALWQKILFNDSNITGTGSGCMGLAMDGSGNIGVECIIKYNTASVLKMDPLGNIKWIRTDIPYSNNIYKSADIAPYGIAMDDSGNMYNTGLITIGAIFGAKDTVHSLPRSKCNIYVSKYNASGVLQWAKNAGSQTGLGDVGYGVYADSKENILVTGAISDTAHFDNVVINKTDEGLYFFLAKIGNTKIVTGIDKKLVSGTNSLSNFPNPFTGNTTIAYTLDEEDFTEISIFNIMGQKVITLVNGRQTQGKHFIEWNATGYPAGIYFYSLRINGGQVKTQKMILGK